MTSSSTLTPSGRAIPNPFLLGLWPLLGVTALALVVFLVVGGLVVFGKAPAGALLLAGLPVALSATISVLELLWGERQVRQIREFLESDRPQVRWTYTPEEWAALREIHWQEAQKAWQLPVGCLAFLLGVAGLMVGGGLAARSAAFSAYDREALLEIGGGAVAGVLVGGLAGGLIGSIVARGNWQAARQSYQRTVPGEVALSRREIYAMGRYVKIDGAMTRLEQVEWEREYPARLLITLTAWRPRRVEETWEIIVPDRVLPQVEGVAQQMGGDAADSV
jgi:hypothetical protein